MYQRSLPILIHEQQAHIRIALCIIHIIGVATMAKKKVLFLTFMNRVPRSQFFVDLRCLQVAQVLRYRDNIILAVFVLTMTMTQPITLSRDYMGR